jgi:hypothetical protein
MHILKKPKKTFKKGSHYITKTTSLHNLKGYQIFFGKQFLFFVLKFNMNLENGPEFKRNKFKKESSIDALKEYLLAP